MYTMVMMMAATSGGDAVAFGGRNRGCDGGCHGAAVVATAPAGCTGSGFGAGCTGTVVGSCHGGTSCTGGSGFLGLRGKLFGGRGCTGSCHGTTVTASCHGGAVVGGCHGGVVTGGCHGGVVVTGCVPTVGTVGGGVVTMPMTQPKKDEPTMPAPNR